MELIQGIKERRSIRQFKDQKVPRDIIKSVVETASFAPSWKNHQIVRYMVIDDPEKIKEIATAECMNHFDHNLHILLKAPVLVVLTIVKGYTGYEKDGSYTTSKKDKWEMFDAGIAAQTFCLAAYEKGLGTVMMGIFDDQKIAEVLGISSKQEVAVLIPMGYPDEAPKVPVRKSVEELMYFVE